MKYKVNYDLSHVTSVDALRKEQAVVRDRLKDREAELRLKMYELPAEIAAAGANSLIPKILRGKITNAALNTGKKLINSFVVPQQNEQKQNLLTHTIKNRNMFSILKKGFGLIKKLK